MSTVKLADVKSHLKITGNDQDGQLQADLDAAEAAIEQRVGPLGLVTVEARIRPAGGGFVVNAPVVSVTSLTPVGGTAYDVATLDVDLLAGTIGRVSGGSFGSGQYDIVYVAGREELPADLRMAVLELVRHFVESRRGPTRRPGPSVGESAANTIPGAAYLFPFRVEQLLSPHTQLGFGFA